MPSRLLQDVGAAKRDVVVDEGTPVRVGIDYRRWMPFKHNAARRHRIPKARYRVRNWPVYEAGLKRRGDLTLWLDESALAGWHAEHRTTPGGQR